MNYIFLCITGFSSSLYTNDHVLIDEYRFYAYLLCIISLMATAASSPKKLIDTALILESKGTHRHSIIWLHGFGDSAEGCKGLFVQIQPPNTRIVLPNAPKKWVTIEGRQYFVQSWMEREETDTENHFKVLESIKELVDNELKLVDSASNIIIGGFR